LRGIEHEGFVSDHGLDEAAGGNGHGTASYEDAVEEEIPF
jgi:hypothetical protein